MNSSWGQLLLFFASSYSERTKATQSSQAYDQRHKPRPSISSIALFLKRSKSFTNTNIRFVSAVAGDQF